MIGVLALQGGFVEHQQMLDACGVDSRQVRVAQELEGLDGLIIPGGESTTMRHLMQGSGRDLFEAIVQRVESGMAIWGTCAGMILLESFQLIDAVVQRNAFGRQAESFVADVQVEGLEGNAFPGVFIRAPQFESIGQNAKAIAYLKDGTIVAARQGNRLATAFHPELTKDNRMHQYFVAMTRETS